MLTHLNNVDLLSGVAPDLKLLVVPLRILSNADSTHLDMKTAGLQRYIHYTFTDN